MKGFLFATFLLTVEAFAAQYLVSKPAEDHCPPLKVEFSQEVLQGHPLMGQPISIKIVETGEQFTYQNRRRFWDSIVSTYKEEQTGKEIHHDDFCMWELSSFACWRINSCQYQ